jgi:hypothetical protein
VDEAPLEKNLFDNLPAFRQIAPNERDKISHYLFSAVEDVKNEDVLMWWHEHKHVFPHLYRMALDYHSVPCKFVLLFFLACILTSKLGTSVEVERVFSQGRLLLPYIRNRLSSESTRALLYLGDWCRRGFVKDGDIKSAALLPDVAGEEPPLAIGWDSIEA